MRSALLVLLASGAVAALVGWLLVRFERLHARISLDDAASGPQKFHAQATPRIGGVPVAAGLLAGAALGWRSGVVGPGFLGAFLLAVLPAYASGLLEDVTKKLGPDMRLWASFLSALLAMLLFDVVVDRADLPLVDSVLAWFPLAMVFTMVGVGGVAHATNIVDGYNGLAGMTSVLMFAALGVVAWQSGDTELATICAALDGATLGFLYWNFPRGRMFAGDGGAYLWGVSAALIGILLVKRNPEVSPWFPLVVVIYPVFETVFTIYRRKFRHASPAGLPDARHLHQLVYRRLLHRREFARADARQRTLRNALTSPFLWCLAAAAIVPATLVARDTSALIAIAIGFCLLYFCLYRALVRFQSPGWLRRLGRRASGLALDEQARQSAQHQDP